MAQQLIDVGTVPDDGTGDTLRNAFIKANDNFTELYTGGSGLALTDLSVSTDAASGGGTLTYNNTTGVFTFAPADLSGVSGSSTTTFNIVNNGASAYTFTGGGTSSDDNPTLYLQKGLTYEFVVNASGHPFEIRSSNGGAAFNDGVTNNGVAVGTVTFTVPMDAPDTLYYQCQVHAGMVGTIITGGGSGLQSRGTVTGTSASLANDASGNIDITGYKGYALLKIQTDRAAWVRIYTDGTSRTADASRTEATDPLPDAGVIAEVITAGAETVVISPGTIGFNNEATPTTTIPVAVKNKSGGTSTVQVTLTVIQLES